MKAMNALRKFTGTTEGASPVLDGTMRTALVGILNALIGLATVSDWVDESQAIYIALMVNPFVFFVFGLWDAFWKARAQNAKLLNDYKEITENDFRANTQFGSVSDTFGAGDAVIGIDNATANPSSGKTLYTERQQPTVGEAMKRARLPQDSRITPAVEKKKQPRDASGRYGSKPKRKR